jgi:murein DD-endopeptidase MepM/ murein hydrolase activator NlpD
MPADAFVLGSPHGRPSWRRALIPFLACLLAWGLVTAAPNGTPGAVADSAVSNLQRRIRSIDHRIHRHRVTVRHLVDQVHRLGMRKQAVEREIHRQRKFFRRQVQTTDRGKSGRNVEAMRLHGHRASIAGRRSALIIDRDHYRRLIEVLEGKQDRLWDQLWRLRPLGMCPVRGSVSFSDDFGAPRYLDGKYDHPHAGNDILASLGSPIVAPFDGRAEASPNSLGGMAVKVFGPEGFVYNAHLSRYGKLGPVQMGDVVGYVGNSGDAAGGPTHDHFEWHPSVMPQGWAQSPYGYSTIGDAVDPYPLLTQVC